MVREQDIQNQILHFLNLQHDIFAWRNQSQGTYDPKIGAYRKKVGFDIKGVSDILGIFAPNGTLIAIEVKRPGVSKPSKEQEVFLEKIKKMGGVSCCTNNLEDVISLVTNMRNQHGLDDGLDT